MIIDPENENKNENNSIDNTPDEFVDSSFMLSMKASDNSVSDKIKENAFGSDEHDEFDNFDYDPSKSAFKPAPVSESKPEEQPKRRSPFESAKASEKTEFETVAEADDPAFNDASIDFEEFTGIKKDENPEDRKLFEQGQNLDFAASSGSKSAFAGSDDEFALDEEALAINPFKPKGADRIPPMPSEPKSEPSAAKNENESANIKTYGKVSSGVNAFKRNDKPDTSIEEKKEQEAPAASKAAPAPAAAPSAGGIVGQANTMKPLPKVAPNKSQENKPQEKAASAPAPVEMEAKAPQEEAPSPFVRRGASKPASNSAKVTATSRPAARQDSASVNNRPVRPQPPLAPAAKHDARPGTPPVAPKSASSEHTNPNIAPVTQVNKSKRRSKADKKAKEPGKGGLFALIGVLAGIFIILWVVDNWSTWFDKNNTDTTPTQVTAVATTEQPEPVETSEETQVPSETEEVVATEETIAETSAETEETVAETEPTETSEETTVETTEETTVETTEVTTATTTEEETEATTTTTRRSNNNDPVSCSYSITHPHTLEDGFSFDISITNNGSDLNMSRLNELTITINTATTVTSLTSDYYTFREGDSENSFIGTPRTGTLPAGETTDTTITAVTEDHVVHFQISNYHFDWD